MDLAELQMLIAAGESETIEFKQSTAQLARVGETLCGFLNASGGEVLRGTQKIVELCVKAGHPEPEFAEQAGTVVVRFLPRGYIVPQRVAHDLTQRQREILQLLAGRDAALREMRVALSHPSSERALRDDLYHLKRLGLIETRGHGRGATWFLVQGAEGLSRI